jgi:threonine aldolase
MQFASDNWGPAAPEIIEAVVRANEGYAAPYGDDELMADVQLRVRDIFEAPDAAVYLVATGTAANALALACLCPPWATIYCHEFSHVQEDECAAPEFFTGGSKLTPLSGEQAKISPESLVRALEASALNGVHTVQKGALSLTNTTEEGAVYSVSEMQALCDLANEHGIGVHLDGARFANALVTQGCTPAEATWKAGVDVLSFGGTKNGLLGVEAVVLFNPDLAWEFELRRKRGGHLFSKHRYLSAQMQAYLRDDLWLRLARQANRAAARLAEGISRISEAHLVNPVDANMVFASWPRAMHVKAQAAGARYHLWPHGQSPDGPGDEPLSARLVCDWSTSDADIDRFLDLIA